MDGRFWYPRYLELDVWFDGPHQKAIAARKAAKHRKAKREAKGLRRPAPIELRRAAVQHSYRYQLQRQARIAEEAPRNTLSQGEPRARPRLRGL